MPPSAPRSPPNTRPCGPRHAGRKGATLVNLDEAPGQPFHVERPVLAPVPARIGVYASTSNWKTWFSTSTGALLPDLGSGRAFPPFSTSGTVGETARQLRLTTPARCSAAWSTNNGSRPAPSSASGPPAAPATTSSSTATKAAPPLGRWIGLRQQHEASPAGRANLALADYVGQRDVYAGAFAVTAGLGIEAKLAEFEAAHDDYSAIMLKALADRLAEAAAEWLHQRVRTGTGATPW